MMMAQPDVCRPGEKRLNPFPSSIGLAMYSIFC